MKAWIPDISGLWEKVSTVLHGGEVGRAASRLNIARERAMEDGRNPDDDKACKALERKLDTLLKDSPKNRL